MTAYKCDIGMVFARYECECDASIHQIVKIVDRNSQLGTHMVARERAFYSDDLDICAVSLAPISLVTILVGILAIKFHGLCWSMDCIRPIER